MNLIQRVRQSARNKLGTRIQSMIHRSVFRQKAYDYVSVAYQQAAVESAEFFLDNMRLAQNTSRKDQLLVFALKEVRIEGLWLEFGVFKGRDITAMAAHTESTIYGFDSFEGLPEDWTYFQRKGRFSLDGALPSVPKNISLVKGWFHDTLPKFLERHEGPVAFLHIDSDLYSSARFVLQSLNERIKPGTIILFDDFLNYPGWRIGEAKAFEEFLEDFNRRAEFIAFASEQQAVAVRIMD